MNGTETRYFNEKFNALKNLVTEIKTENKIKWEEHNKRALELQTWLTKEFTDLKTEDKAQNEILSHLPCEVHIDRMKSIKWHIGLLWGFMVAIITVFGIVIRVIAGG